MTRFSNRSVDEIVQLSTFIYGWEYKKRSLLWCSRKNKVLKYTIICALFITNGFAITVEKPIPEILFIEAGNDLDDLEDAIDSALSYLKKVLNSSSLSDVQYYARKANNYASEAEDIADDLELDDIEYYCYKAYKCARAAEGESSMENAIAYLTTARKSMQNAYYEL